jgi:hypothetical protein
MLEASSGGTCAGTTYRAVCAKRQGWGVMVVMPLELAKDEKI